MFKRIVSLPHRFIEGEPASCIEDDEGWCSPLFSSYDPYSPHLIRLYKELNKPLVPNLFRMYRTLKWHPFWIENDLRFLKANCDAWDDKYLPCYLRMMNDYNLSYGLDNVFEV